MTSIERMDINNVPWDELDRFEDRTVFQILPWLNFVAITQRAKPVVAAIRENGCTIGYFTGLIIRRFGLRIFGSPFKGWTTAYMGFNLRPGSSHRKALTSALSFVFQDLKCHHFEMLDRHIHEEDYRDLTFTVKYLNGYEIDLTKSEDELFAGMKSSCRRCIRKANKCGVVIEEASDIDFANDYYEQLKDVFVKQSLVPTYGIGRVQELIKHLQPTGHLLLLRAKNPEGLCIATGIFPAFNDTMYFWGGASWQKHQMLRPNEALMWYAIRYWKAHGMKKFDMGGGGDYKKKYGGYTIRVPRLIKSKYGFLVFLRNLAERTFEIRQKMLGQVKKRKNS